MHIFFAKEQGRLENQAVLVLFCYSAFFHLAAALVKGRVAGVEVLRVEVILRDPYAVAKSLIMHYLALTKEFYRIANVGIVGQAQNVIVGRARLLLC